MDDLWWTMMDDSLVSHMERRGSHSSLLSHSSFVSHSSSMMWLSDWRAVMNETGRGLEGMVNFVPDLINLHFSVEVPSHDVVGLNKRIEFSLEIFVLLLEKGGMFLKSLILGFEVKVSVHQGLVGVVDSFKISVLSSLLNFKTVVLGFQALQLGGEFVGKIVFLTVFSQLLFLVFNQ